MPVDLNPNQIEMWVARHFEYRRRKGGAELRINNPFDGDTKYKFNINTVKGVCHDWRPGHQHFDGPFIRFVQKYKNLSFADAIRDICGQEVDIKSILKRAKAREVPEDDTEIVPDVSLPTTARPFKDGKADLNMQMAENYLASRGISLETACKYNLHYGIDRIYFPYYEYGVQVYWQARAIHSKTFDFPSLEDTQIGKDHYLYGFDNAEPGTPLLICESIICSITLGDGAVASGGADMGIPQCKKIRAIGPSEIILAPDRDFEGLSSVLANAEMIESICDAPIKFVIPPAPHKDWNDMRDDARDYALSHTSPATANSVHKYTAAINSK